MLVQIQPCQPILGVRTNGGRLAVNQVTRIGTRFDSLRSHQFIGAVNKSDLSVRRGDSRSAKSERKVSESLISFQLTAGVAPPIYEEAQTHSNC